MYVYLKIIILFASRSRIFKLINNKISCRNASTRKIKEEVEIPVTHLSGRRQITYNVLRGLPNWISDNTYDGGLMNNAPVAVGGRECRTRKSVDLLRPRWIGHPLIIKDKRSLFLSFSLIFFSVSHYRARAWPTSSTALRRRLRGPHTWPYRMACRERSTDNLQGR